MSAAARNKLSGVSLPLVLQRANLQNGALERVAGLESVEAVVAALAQAGLGIEATRVLAHALPKREAVWWACMCAAHSAPADLTEGDRAVRELAENWVRQQTQELARAAMDAAQKTGMQSPEAWAGAGAFWSGETMAPPEAPVVLPAPHLTGVAVAGAVALASVRLNPARQAQRLAMFLQSAQDIVAGGPGRLQPEAE